MQATKTLAAAGGGRIQFEGAPWNNSTVDLIRAAKAHCDLVLHKTFVESVQDLKNQASPRALAHECTQGFAGLGAWGLCQGP